MKRVKRIKLLILALVFSVTAILPLQAQSAYADQLGNVTMFNVPNPKSYITEDSDGAIWAPTSPTSKKVYKLDRISGNYTEFSNLGSFTSLTSGSDGNIWMLSNFALVKMKKDGSASTAIPLPTSHAAGTGSEIVNGPDDNLWFGTYLNTGNYEQKIQRMNTNGGIVASYAINGRPEGSLVPDISGQAIWLPVWQVNSSGAYTNQTVIEKIAMDGTRTSFAAPSTVGNITSMRLGLDGNLWFSNNLGIVGKMTPSGTFSTYNFNYSSSNGFRKIAIGLDGNIWLTRNNATISKLTTSGVITNYQVFPTGSQYPSLVESVAAAKDGNIWLAGVSNGVHKIIKFGTGYTDDDEDGLQYSQEIAQGTVDNNPDYDGDGLSDYVESTSYTARGSVFCNQAQTTCEYPDPLAKDIYVESDWMDKPGANGYSMQLSNTQVQSIKDSFDDKNITLHIDTGQLGGGSEVPYNANIYYGAQPNSVDFYDYKLGGNGITAQFAPDRRDIYHYMISGDSYRDDATGQPSLSSGGSYTGDDDFFVSYGYIKENMQSEYSTFDTAISGTTMHELGHGLCLSKYNNGNPEYPGQPADCRFAGVDASFGNTYNSVMNYDMQFSIVDYSDGILGAPNDHNDWNAIRLADFNKHNIGDWQHGFSTANPTFKAQKTKQNVKKPKLNVGPTLKQLRNPQR